MSFEVIQKKIAKHFDDGWKASALSNIAVIPDNLPAPQPNNAPWCRYSLGFSSSANATVDGKFRRALGFVWLQIFIPANQGTLLVQKVVDVMETIFANKSLTTSSGDFIRFERAESKNDGEENGWYQWRCTVEFMVDSNTGG